MASPASKKEEKSDPPPLPFFQKKKVVFRLDNDLVSVRLFKELSEIEGAPIVVGFPNIGITPVLACNYLVNSLDLNLIGTIAPEDMASTAVVSHTGQPCHAIRIFGDKRLVVLCAELKIPDNLINGLSRAVVSFTQAMKSQMVWCVEGVPAEEKTEKINRDKMQFLTTCEATGKKLDGLGHEVLVDAVIAGVSGGIISEMVDCGAAGHATALLAPASPHYPDAWPSVMIIQLLDSLYDTWSSDTAELETKASSLEDTVKGLMSNNLRRNYNHFWCINLFLQ